MRVHLTTRHRLDQIFRQTPNGDGVWHDLEFIRSDPDKTAHWLVVFDQPYKDLTVRIPWQRRILFLTEPPEIKIYPMAYLNQFGIVVSPMRLSGSYRGTQLNQQSALPWHYGVNMDQADRRNGALDWRALASGPNKNKTEFLSVICSNKRKTTQQRHRLEFVEYLQKRLGDSVHVFGRGFRQIPDKADAIAPYRYHIVLENNLIDHFWTEKLADSYLGGAYPFFAGCANIDTYFSSWTFSAIDIRNPLRAADVIETALDTNLYDKGIDHLNEARIRVMEVHNLFAVCSTLLRRFAQANPNGLDFVGQEKIYSVSDYQVANTIGRARRRLRRLIRIN